MRTENGENMESMITSAFGGLATLDTNGDDKIDR